MRKSPPPLRFRRTLALNKFIAASIEMSSESFGLHVSVRGHCGLAKDLQSVCMSVSHCLFVTVCSCVSASLCACVCLSLRHPVSICVSVCPTLSVSSSLHVCLRVSLFLFPSPYLIIWPCVFTVFLAVSVYLSVRLSVCLNVRLCRLVFIRKS